MSRDIHHEVVGDSPGFSQLLVCLCLLHEYHDERYGITSFRADFALELAVRCDDFLLLLDVSEHA
jgi:hypothetical protein